MTLKAISYDSAEFLCEDISIGVYLEEAFKTREMPFILYAFSTIARAKGMTLIAVQAGVSRKQLFDVFRRGGGTLNRRIVSAVMKTLTPDENLMMTDALNTIDAVRISDVMSHIAHAKGMAFIAEQAGISRAQLEDSFKEGNKPSRKITLALKKALGIGLPTEHAA